MRSNENAASGKGGIPNNEVIPDAIQPPPPPKNQASFLPGDGGSPADWRELPGAPGVLVSRFGNVKGARVSIGEGRRSLSLPGGKSERLARAVWRAWRGPVPVGFEVHHCNGDRLDDRLSNLDCLSASAHRRADLALSGREPFEEIYPAETIMDAARAAHAGASSEDIASRFGMSHRHARHLRARDRRRAECHFAIHGVWPGGQRDLFAGDSFAGTED